MKNMWWCRHIRELMQKLFWFTVASRKSLFRNYILSQRTTRTEHSLLSRPSLLVDTSTQAHWLECQTTNFRLTSMNQNVCGLALFCQYTVTRKWLRCLCCCSPHQYGYAPKGSSVIMYKTKALRHFQVEPVSQCGHYVLRMATVQGLKCL